MIYLSGLVFAIIFINHVALGEMLRARPSKSDLMTFKNALELTLAVISIPAILLYLFILNRRG